MSHDSSGLVSRARNTARTERFDAPAFHGATTVNPAVYATARSNPGDPGFSGDGL